MVMRSVACGTAGVMAGLLMIAACASDDGAAGAGGVGVVELACDDEKDNDSDGETDCDDPDCEDTAACVPGAGGGGQDTGSGGATPGGSGNIETSCTNRVDDDDDGDTDCDDSDCGFHPDCGAPPTGGATGTGGASAGIGGASTGTGGSVTAEYDCSNGADDDVDGDTDCDDSDCSILSICGGPLADVCLLAPQVISLPTDSVTGALATTDPTNGPRGSAYYFDSYVFSTSVGDSVTFELVDGNFDTYLYLLDADCTVLASNDDGGSGTLSRLPYTFNEADTYVIVVTSFGSRSTGAYTLDVTPSAPTMETSCDDGLDNDDDGYVDCEDSDCSNNSACPEVCDDGEDNDYDGYVDCYDSECEDDPNCIEICDDEEDNDLDGYTDCQDSDCADDLNCAEICVDGLDNDYDGYTDCRDMDCVDDPSCIEVCDDGEDNDADGYTDCADTQCTTDPACVTGPCTAGTCLCLAGPDLTLPSDIQTGDLETTDPQGGPRGTTRYYDAYEFEGTAGQLVEVELTQGDFDTYLYLLAPDCSVEASDDDGGTSLLSRISTTLAYSGVYTVVVTQFSSGLGSYTLSIDG
jgi:hypothetical protein